MGPDLADKLFAYEEGDLEERETLELFAALVGSGWAWQLQGHYGRTAAYLIEAGLISRTGDVIETC